MNITVDDMMQEIGSLHVQVKLLQKALAEANEKLAKYAAQEKPATEGQTVQS